MLSIAAYVMRGRIQAILAISICAVMALSSPLLFIFAYLGGAIVTLSVLRHGAKEGLGVVVGAMILVGLLAMLAGTSPVLAAIYGLVFWLPVWALASILGLTNRPGIVVTVAGVFATAVIVALHMVIGDVSQWWLDSMLKVSVEFELNLDREALAAQAEILTGLVVASAFVLGQVSSVLWGRWWQSVLYNPGGFQKEFYALRIPRMVSPIAVAIVAYGIYAASNPESGSMAIEFMIVVVLMYLFQGLAVVHCIAKARGLTQGWLVTMYVMLLFVPTVSVKLLAGAGILDVWANFRDKVETPQARQ